MKYRPVCCCLFFLALSARGFHFALLSMFALVHVPERLLWSGLFPAFGRDVGGGGGGGGRFNCCREPAAGAVMFIFRLALCDTMWTPRMLLGVCDCTLYTVTPILLE